MQYLRVVRALRYSLGHLGLLGWVGVALIAAAAAYAGIVVPQRNDQMQGLRGDIAQWQQRREMLAAAAAKAPPVAAQATMPTVAETPAALLALRDMARKDNLQVSRNDYRYENTTAPDTGQGGKGSRGGNNGGNGSNAAADGSGLMEVHITVPASGSYHDLRAFLSHALDQLPSLALDDAALKRDAIGNGSLQAQLRFTLFVRRDS